MGRFEKARGCTQFADRSRAKPSESSSARQCARKKAKEAQEVLLDKRSKKVPDDDAVRGKFKRAKAACDRLAKESDDDEHGQKRERPMGKKRISIEARQAASCLLGPDNKHTHTCTCM